MPVWILLPIFAAINRMLRSSIPEPAGASSPEEVLLMKNPLHEEW